jgi:chromosome segregation ATPase
MSAELIIGAAASTGLGLEAGIKTLRSQQVSRIQQADREIPKLYADIKAVEERIEHYRKDREWCVESLKTLEARLAEMKE